MNTINHIIDNIYLTDQFGASNEQQLIQNDIKVIINMSPVTLRKYERCIYKNYPIDDKETQEIISYINTIIKEIHTIGNNTNILICCQAGASRSASIVIGYLINKGYTYQESYNIVLQKRPIICPNRGFCKQLQEYEKIYKL